MGTRLNINPRLIFKIERMTHQVKNSGSQVLFWFEDVLKKVYQFK